MTINPLSVEEDRVGILPLISASGNVIWRVDVVRNKICARRNFHAMKYGGVDLALQAAKAWRDEAIARMKCHPAKTEPNARRQSLRSALDLPHRSLAAMHEHARAAGMTCLDTKWKGANHHYRFKCVHGHTWARTRNEQRKNPSCPTCNHNGQRVGESEVMMTASTRLQWLRDVAQSRGGECLSSQFLGFEARHRFRCGSGHEWTAVANSLRGGTWCSRCRREALRITPEEAHLEAKIQGGRCLSTDFVSRTRPLTWECAQGHVWHASLATLRRSGLWCAQCARVARTEACLRED